MLLKPRTLMTNRLTAIIKLIVNASCRYAGRIQKSSRDHALKGKETTRSVCSVPTLICAYKIPKRFERIKTRHTWKTEMY